MNGELSIPNVKSFETFPDDDTPEVTHVHFNCGGELLIAFQFTAEQRADLASQLAAPA